MPSARQLPATAGEGTTIMSTAGSRHDLCVVTRSVITVMTGAPGCACWRASTAGQVTMPWNATTAAGRCALTAAATRPRTAPKAVRRTTASAQRLSENRHDMPQSHGASLMPGAYRLTTNRSRNGVPRPASAS
jgi:hypothetical protein